MSDGKWARPPVASATRPRSTALSRTSGSSRATTSEAPITGSSATTREPSTIRRPSAPDGGWSASDHCGVCGTNGQNARRPKIVSSAGSSVSMEIAAQATPMAAIGPRPEVPLTRAMLRQSRAAITVAAEANTAGPAEVIAARMASWRSNVWWSSSRYLATIRSA